MFQPTETSQNPDDDTDMRAIRMVQRQLSTFDVGEKVNQMEKETVFEKLPLELENDEVKTAKDKIDANYWVTNKYLNDVKELVEDLSVEYIKLDGKKQNDPNVDVKHVSVQSDESFISDTAMARMDKELGSLREEIQKNYKGLDVECGDEAMEIDESENVDENLKVVWTLPVTNLPKSAPMNEDDDSDDQLEKFWTSLDDVSPEELASLNVVWSSNGGLINQALSFDGSFSIQDEYNNNDGLMETNNNDDINDNYAAHPSKEDIVDWQKSTSPIRNDEIVDSSINMSEQANCNKTSTFEDSSLKSYVLDIVQEAISPEIFLQPKENVELEKTENEMQEPCQINKSLQENIVDSTNPMIHEQKANDEPPPKRRKFLKRPLLKYETAIKKHSSNTNKPDDEEEGDEHSYARNLNNINIEDTITPPGTRTFIKRRKLIDSLVQMSKETFIKSDMKTNDHIEASPSENVCCNEMQKNEEEDDKPSIKILDTDISKHEAKLNDSNFGVIEEQSSVASNVYDNEANDDDRQVHHNEKTNQFSSEKTTETIVELSNEMPNIQNICNVDQQTIFCDELVTNIEEVYIQMINTQKNVEPVESPNEIPHNESILNTESLEKNFDDQDENKYFVENNEINKNEHFTDEKKCQSVDGLNEVVEEYIIDTFDANKEMNLHSENVDVNQETIQSDFMPYNILECIINIQGPQKPDYFENSNHFEETNHRTDDTNDSEGNSKNETIQLTDEPEKAVKGNTSMTENTNNLYQNTLLNMDSQLIQNVTEEILPFSEILPVCHVLFEIPNEMLEIKSQMENEKDQLQTEDFLVEHMSQEKNDLNQEISVDCMGEKVHIQTIPEINQKDHGDIEITPKIDTTDEISNEALTLKYQIVNQEDQLKLEDVVVESMSQDKYSQETSAPEIAEIVEAYSDENGMVTNTHYSNDENYQRLQLTRPEANSQNDFNDEEFSPKPFFVTCGFLVETEKNSESNNDDYTIKNVQYDINSHLEPQQTETCSVNDDENRIGAPKIKDSHNVGIAEIFIQHDTEENPTKRTSQRLKRKFIRPNYRDIEKNEKTNDKSKRKINRNFKINSLHTEQKNKKIKMDQEKPLQSLSTEDNVTIKTFEAKSYLENLQGESDKNVGVPISDEELLPIEDKHYEVPRQEDAKPISKRLRRSKQFTSAPIDPIINESNQKFEKSLATPSTAVSDYFYSFHEDESQKTTQLNQDANRPKRKRGRPTKVQSENNEANKEHTVKPSRKSQRLLAKVAPVYVEVEVDTDSSDSQLVWTKLVKNASKFPKTDFSKESKNFVRPMRKSGRISKSKIQHNYLELHRNGETGKINQNVKDIKNRQSKMSCVSQQVEEEPVDVLLQEQENLLGGRYRSVRCIVRSLPQ